MTGIGIAHRAQAARSWNLIIQIDTILTMTKVQLPELCEESSAQENHGKALAEPCVCQKTPPRPCPPPRRKRRADRIVHAQILVVLGDRFTSALVLGKKREVLDEIQKPCRFAQPRIITSRYRRGSSSRSIASLVKLPIRVSDPRGCHYIRCDQQGVIQNSAGIPFCRCL